MDKAMYEALIEGRVTIEDLRRRHPPRSPWRAEALEAKLLEAEAVIVLASKAVGIDHPAWVILDDYDGSMDAVREIATHQRKLSAQLIRDELVCCDIYQRLQDLYTEDGKPTYAHRTLRNSVEYHAICHYGEWAARIVEKGERSD